MQEQVIFYKHDSAYTCNLVRFLQLMWYRYLDHGEHG